MRRVSWMGWAGLFLLVISGPMPAAQEMEEDLATKAVRFSTLFLEGVYEDYVDMMSADMATAFPEAGANKAHERLVDPHGTVEKVGPAWLEAEEQGYRRYRLPVDFEQVRLDFRVIFDSDGEVAGFLQVPHVPDPSRASSGPSHEAAGHWEGAIETPGVKLGVLIDLLHDDGAWSGTCDIPMQGAKSLPLGGFRVEGNEIRFSIIGIPGDPTFEGKLADGRIEGDFLQAGNTLPFSLGREEIARPGRPQEPKPPFPYESEDVTYRNGEIELAGTLTLPSGEGPFPAALLITGSGAQNRDEEIFEHKPFLVLADHLTRAGIAVLRVDDRGVGGSGGSLATSTTEDLAGDAAAGVGYLKTRREIDGKSIGLIGHSEGGLIAPMVAIDSKNVSYVVMLAGTGVPGGEILVRQVELIIRAAGVDDEHVEVITREQQKLIEMVRAGADDEKIRAQYRTLVIAQVKASNPDEEPDEKVIDEMAGGAAQITSPWFRFFMDFDPRPTLRKVRVPVLALCGEKDLQVDPEQNLPEIRKALRKNKDATVLELEALNHLFQTAGTGSPDEYYSIEETFDPGALDMIRDWILERFNPGEPASAGAS